MTRDVASKPFGSEPPVFDHLVDGTVITLENATDLYGEARILHNAGSLSRALFLHQISLEECAKVEMLGTYALSTLLNLGSDQRKLYVAMTSHKAKNYTNAYLLPASEAEADARLASRATSSSTSSVCPLAFVRDAEPRSCPRKWCIPGPVVPRK